MDISRVDRSKQAAQKAYNRMSWYYDSLTGSSESKYMLLGLQMLAVKPGETILEIGCGTGKALLELSLQLGDTGKVYALDLSPGMLQVARDRLKNAGVNSRDHLLIGDGAALPYSDQAFSALFMCFTLELFDTPEIPIVLSECRRVLIPGGRLGVVSLLKPDQPNWTVQLYEWFHEVLPAYVDCRPIQAGRMVQEAGFSLDKQNIRNMWGLPVELILAFKAS